MTQERMTIDQVQSILNEIQFMDWQIRLMEKGDGYLIQWVFMDIDVDNPTAGPQAQHCRKWYVSPYSTRSEIVETAWKAVKVAMEHELREKFLYRGRRIFDPHLDVEVLVKLCDSNSKDVRG